MRKLLLLCLSLSLSFNLLGSLPVNAQSNDSVSIISQDYGENINVVETTDGEYKFKATYNKDKGELKIEKIKNNVILEEFNINQNRSSYYVASPTESDLGFGYYEQPTLTTYACSHEMLENGLADYRGITVKNTSASTIQTRFKSNVDKVIVHESKLDSLTNSGNFAIILGIIAIGVGQGWAAVAAGIRAIEVSFEIEAESKSIFDLQEKLKDNFITLSDYNIN